MSDNPYSPEKQASIPQEFGKEALENKIDQADPASDVVTPAPKVSDGDVTELQNQLGDRSYSPRLESEAKIGRAEQAAYSNQPRLDLHDQTYRDAQNREITIRSHNNDTQHMIRAYDRAQNPEVPTDASMSKSIGQCTLTEEKEPYMNYNTGQWDTHTDRVRINDITVADNYQSNGTGGRMLESAEEIAQKTGAREIYGTFTPKPGKEVELRSFYEKHGYSFRQAGNAEEIYKTFYFK